MARFMGQSIFKLGLGRCSQYAEVSTYYLVAQECQPVNQQQGHGCPKLIDAWWKWMVASLVESDIRIIVVYTAENVNVGFDWYQNTQFIRDCWVVIVL